MKKKFLNSFKDIFFYKLLQSHLRGAQTVLDVACGANSPIQEVKKTFKSEGIDIFKPSIVESKKRGIHDSYKIGDILKLDQYYPPKSFDAVVCLDAVEHFTMSEGKKLVKMMESIARKKVIIMTPNGFYHQDHLDGNIHQEHKSGWSVPDFKSLGYKLEGIRGLKFIRGEHATIKYKPWILWGLLAFISEPIFYFFPQLSYQLFAVKKVNEKKSH